MALNIPEQTNLSVFILLHSLLLVSFSRLYGLSMCAHLGETISKGLLVELGNVWRFVLHMCEPKEMQKNKKRCLIDPRVANQMAHTPRTSSLCLLFFCSVRVAIDTFHWILFGMRHVVVCFVVWESTHQCWILDCQWVA
jgi:hypothetical protein